MTTPASKIDYRNRLLGLQRRIKALNGLTADPSALNGLADFLDRALSEPDKERLKEMCGLFERAHNNDNVAIRELNENVVTSIDNYAKALGKFLPTFFQVVNLGEGDRPEFDHSQRQQMNVRYIAEDGGHRVFKAVKARKKVFPDLHELWVDGVGYPIRDLYQGNIAPAQMASYDLAFDWASKADSLAYDFLTSSANGFYGSFRTTGRKLDRTYVPNDRIDTDNLPTTNDLECDSNTTSTKFRFNVIEKIMEYCEAWADIFGSPIRPTGAILVPSGDATNMSAEIKPTGLTNNSVADAVLADYSQFSYMKTNWTIIPDATLSPGVCYPVLNRPVGQVYYKPSMDADLQVVETDKKKNWEERAMGKVFGLAVPEPWRVFGCRVRYRTAS